MASPSFPFEVPPLCSAQRGHTCITGEDQNQKCMVVRGWAGTPPWEPCLSTSLSVKCRRFPILVSAVDGEAGVVLQLERLHQQTHTPNSPLGGELTPVPIDGSRGSLIKLRFCISLTRHSRSKQLSGEVWRAAAPPHNTAHRVI